MDFQEVCLECIRNKELVGEYNRLTGKRLGVDSRAPIEKIIDETIGYQAELDKKEMGFFVLFVLDVIWLPVIAGGE